MGKRPRIQPPSIDVLKERLAYDPITGIFRWKISGRGGSLAGSVAGGESHGYIKIGLCGRRYYAHHLAWLYVKGVWAEEIDHRNLCGTDNSIENLREAEHWQNSANGPSRPKIHSSLKGAYKSVEGRWFSSIRVNGKVVYLGRFPSDVAAHEAYVAAAKKVFGEFARAA